MLKLGKRFAQDEDAAVTVDWVMLTAGVVALNILLVVNMIEDGIRLNAEYINGNLAEATEDLN